MNPQVILKEIKAFAAARIVCELSGGPASDSYLLQRDDDKFVLRLDTNVAETLGLDRIDETEILQYINQKGLGPKPEFIAPDRGILITRYIEGRAWSRADLQDTGQIKKLTTILRHLHSLQPVGQPFNLHARIAGYERNIGTAEGRELADDTQRQLRKLEVQSDTQCLCHNDLVCSNIIEVQDLAEGKILALIDWEYAAIGDPFFDLATIAEHHGFDQDKSNGLLVAYFGEAREKDSLRLDRFRGLYANLKLLWLASVEKSQELDAE